MAQIPGFDPFAVDCPACGSLDVEITDAGWSCPHCKNDGGPETVVVYEVEVEQAAPEPTPEPAPLTVEAEPPAVAATG